MKTYKLRGFDYVKTVYGYEEARREGFNVEKSENRMVTIWSGKKDKVGFPYHIFIKKINVSEKTTDKVIVGQNKGGLQ